MNILEQIIATKRREITSAQNGNKHGRRQGTKQTMTQGRPMQVNNGRPAKGSVKPEAPKTEERVKTAEKAKAAEVKTAEKQAVKTSKS